MEKGINDESALDKLYDTYMDNDNLNLLYEEFDYILVNLIYRKLQFFYKRRYRKCKNYK